GNFNAMIKTIQANEKELNKKVNEKTNEVIRIKNMQFRMSPHYLYNSLNSILALIHKNSDKCERALILLSNNYRFMTEISNKDLIYLKEEWKFMENYLEFEKIRYEKNVSIRLARPSIFPTLLIPPYTLQPIVENSFKHGWGEKDQLSISVKCLSIKNGVKLTFIDDGVGIDSPLKLERTMGNIIERLRYYYKDVSYSFANQEEKGLRIELVFENLKRTS
ncbi:MAG: histidine kinase, partial [Spirochaetota bacterium]